MRLIKAILRRAPKLVWRVLNIALNPQAHLRQLGLVIAVQLVSVLLRKFRLAFLCGYDEAVRRQESATTASEWLGLQKEIDSRSWSRGDVLCERDREVNYAGTPTRA